MVSNHLEEPSVDREAFAGVVADGVKLAINLKVRADPEGQVMGSVRDVDQARELGGTVDAHWLNPLREGTYWLEGDNEHERGLALALIVDE